MQPRFVVPEQSHGGFILDLTPRHKALPVQALDLQRAEQCLAARIDAQQTRLPLWRFILLRLLQSIKPCLSGAGVRSTPARLIHLQLSSGSTKSSSDRQPRQVRYSPGYYALRSEHRVAVLLPGLTTKKPFARVMAITREGREALLGYGHA
jgi:hypothetical protein